MKRVENRADKTDEILSYRQVRPFWPSLAPRFLSYQEILPRNSIQVFPYAVGEFREWHEMVFAEFEPHTMSWTGVWSSFRYFLFSSVLWVYSLQACARGQTEMWAGHLWTSIPRPSPFNNTCPPCPQLCFTSSFLTSYRITGAFSTCAPHLPKKVPDIVPSPLLQANAHPCHPIPAGICLLLLTRHQPPGNGSVHVQVL